MVDARAGAVSEDVHAVCKAEMASEMEAVSEVGFQVVFVIGVGTGLAF